jgi:hypothetical protein
MKIYFVVLLIAFCLVIVIINNIYDVNFDGNHVRNKNKFEDALLGEEFDNLFHFLHISDLHISKFKDISRIKDFRYFCTDVVNVVKPRVVSYVF